MKKLLFSLAVLTTLPGLAMDPSTPSATSGYHLSMFLESRQAVAQKNDINNNNNSQEEHPAAKPIEGFAPFEELPKDTIKEIFNFLNGGSWFNAFLTSKQFKKELNSMLEQKLGKEKLEQLKHDLLEHKGKSLKACEKYENELKKITSYWFQNNKRKDFIGILNHFMHSEDIRIFGSSIIPIFIKYAPQYSCDNCWILFKEKLYSTTNAESEAKKFLNSYDKDKVILKGLVMWNAADYPKSYYIP